MIPQAGSFLPMSNTLAWTDGQVKAIVHEATLRFMRSRAYHQMRACPCDIKGEAALVFVRVIKAVAKRPVRDPAAAAMAAFKVSLDRHIISLYRKTVAKKRDGATVSLDESWACVEESAQPASTVLLDAPESVRGVLQDVLEKGVSLSAALESVPPRRRAFLKKQAESWATQALLA